MTSRKKREAAAAEVAERPAAIEAATAILRAALARCPLLLLHDATLPSATSAIVGAPVVGSWWGHPKGAVIFGALQVVEEDVALPKLVRGKVTLVDRSLWPALVAVGRAEEPWQLVGLRPETRALLAQITAAGSARTDRLRESGDVAAVGRAVDQLERRLLVASEQVHTASGRHARELFTWRRWQRQMGLVEAALPTVASARAMFEAAVEGWDGAGGALLPWGAGSSDPGGSSRSGPAVRRSSP